MKTLKYLILLVLVPSLTFAQWTLDNGHSKFTFIAKHHGISEVDGYFKKFTGTLTSSKADISDGVFEISIESNSIFTDLEMRDNHLKSEDLFNAEKYPNITFKSTSFKKKKNNKYILIGDLTMKGITKSVSFNVIMNGPVPNPNKNANNMQIGMKATSKIKRSDFGIGGKLETIMVGDEIELRITGEFNKPNT